MNALLTVPEGLEADLHDSCLIDFCWDDPENRKSQFLHRPKDPNGSVRIVYQPVPSVEIAATGVESGKREVIAVIPLCTMVSIDVDCPETRVSPGREGIETVEVPVSRWVLHPDRGLVRFAER